MPNNNLARRLARLELEAGMATEATLCPHLPPLVVEQTADQTADGAVIYSDQLACDCGRPRLTVQITEVQKVQRAEV